LSTNDSDFARWKNEGLADDRMSLENGAVISQCTRWPLMIDPQLQGIKWIRNRIKNLRVVQLSQKRWLQTIIEAVQSGETVLIEGIGQVRSVTSYHAISSRNVMSHHFVVHRHEMFFRVVPECHSNITSLYMQCNTVGCGCNSGSRA
jgi:hypothetical protein